VRIPREEQIAIHSSVEPTDKMKEDPRLLMSRGSSCLEVEKSAIEPATITNVLLAPAVYPPNKPDGRRTYRPVPVCPFGV
jgi:hypothetical protein